MDNATTEAEMNAEIHTDMTRAELAAAVAEMLADLHSRGLDYAVGLTPDGELDYCHEGGRTLAVVLVAQACDVDSYGGGDMGAADIDAVADAFRCDWLDQWRGQLAWREDAASA